MFATAPRTRTPAGHAATLLLCASAIALFGCATVAAPPATGPIDWAGAGDEATPMIVTTDADGSHRETRLWIVVLDGEGYIRTGESRWFWNIQREPEVVLHIAGAAYPLRAEPVEDDALRDRLNQRFRAKYGWWDRIIHPCGAPDANFMRLAPR